MSAGLFVFKRIIPPILPIFLYMIDDILAISPMFSYSFGLNLSTTKNSPHFFFSFNRNRNMFAILERFRKSNFKIFFAYGEDMTMTENSKKFWVDDHFWLIFPIILLYNDPFSSYMLMYFGLKIYIPIFLTPEVSRRYLIIFTVNSRERYNREGGLQYWKLPHFWFNLEQLTMLP